MLIGFIGVLSPVESSLGEPLPPTRKKGILSSYLKEPLKYRLVVMGRYCDGLFLPLKGETYVF